MFLKETKWLSFCVLYFVIFISAVESQICTEWGLISFWEPHTISFPYLGTYQGECSRGKCNKTRTSFKTEIENRLVHIIGVLQKCCKGYIRDEFDTLNNTCNAVCFPACKNGYCDSPGQCKCNNGYERDSKDTHTCLPTCNTSCIHGICTSPNNCSCSFGYERINLLCQPICDEPCLNGTCTAPGTCECLDGYRKTDNNTCMPYCSRGCIHGVCSEPEKCTCHLGWQHHLGDDWQCIPEDGELTTQTDGELATQTATQSNGTDNTERKGVNESVSLSK